MSLLSQWSSRVFSVELDGAPFYFSIAEKRRGLDAPLVFRGVQNCDRCYAVFVCSGDRISGAKFHVGLREKLSRALPPEVDVSHMSSFVPNVQGSLVKGYFLKDRSQRPFSSERLLRDIIRHDPVLVCSYVRDEGGQVWTQRLWSRAGSQMMDNVSKECCVVHSEAPEYHPSTLNIINSDVFYSFEEAREVMKQVVMVSSSCVA